MRLTRKYLLARFEHVAEALDWNIGQRWTKAGDSTVTGAVVGHVALDYAAVYGGYDITQIVNTGGAERSLTGNGFGGSRLSPRELDAWFGGALCAAEMLKAKRS